MNGTTTEQSGNGESRRRYFVQYVDGTYAVCTAYDADDALNIMASSVEMAHGPIAGEPPAGGEVDDLG